MQELGRETQAQFRASFFPSAGLKLGVRHLLRPLTPRFTSPCNYICASAPCPSPPKDNVTICLFNCLSVTLLQALSVGVYGFFFHLYLFIYLVLRSGGCLAPRNRESLFGLVSHGYNSTYFHPQSSCAPMVSIQAQSLRLLFGGWRLGALRVIVHDISITINQSMKHFSYSWNTKVLFNCYWEVKKNVCLLLGSGSIFSQMLPLWSTCSLCCKCKKCSYFI